MAQLRALRGAATGNPAAGISGQSAHGGLTATLWSLRQRGLLNQRNEITDAGKAEIDALEINAPRDLRGDSRVTVHADVGGKDQP
jgi:hypothetical protein